MNDHASQERQVLIASAQPATEVELRLNEQLAFEKARVERIAWAVREVLTKFPRSMPVLARRILEHSLGPH